MLQRFALVTATVALAAALLAGAAGAKETYYFDPGHTEIFFGWSHAGVSMQHGEFTRAKGKLILDPDKIENSSIVVSIDATSVATGVPALDKHLKGVDYLNVEKYPVITFKSTAVERTGEKTAEVTGDLTIHGVTEPVTLQVELTHRGPHPVAKFIDYYRGDWVAFAARTEIDHLAFNVGSISTGMIFIEINTEMMDREN